VAAPGGEGGVGRVGGPLDWAGSGGEGGEVGGGVLGTDQDGAHAGGSGLANDSAGQDAKEIATSPPVIWNVAGGLVAGDEDDIGPGTQHRQHGRGGGEASHEALDQKVGHALHRPSLGGEDLEGKLEIAIERLGSQASAQLREYGGVV